MHAIVDHGSRIDCSTSYASTSSIINYIAYHGVLDNISKNWLGMSWNEGQTIIEVYDNFLGDDHGNNKPYDALQQSLWLFYVNSIQ